MVLVSFQEAYGFSSPLRDDAGLSQAVRRPIIPIFNGWILGLEYIEFGESHVIWHVDVLRIED